MSRTAWLVCSDLFFSARIRETARHRDVSIHAIGAVTPAGEEAQAETPFVILVDLDAEKLAPLERIRELCLRFPDVPIVGFVRHERVDLIRGAREAGAGRVLARGAFTNKLPELLDPEKRLEADDEA